MTKSEEISLLARLYDGDSYFSREFSREDFNQMVANIRNDHPIFMGTAISEAARHWQCHCDFLNETEMTKFQCEVSRKIDNGNVTLKVIIHDPFGEGDAVAYIRETEDGTDYTTRVCVNDRLNGFSDIGDGVGRIFHRLAVCGLYKLIDKYFYDIPVDEIAQDWI